MLVQSIADLENTTSELNMELESLEEDNGGKIFLVLFHFEYKMNIFHNI